jgi:hypothetical protein
MDYKVIGWWGVGWMHLAQDRSKWQTLVNTLNLEVHRCTQNIFGGLGERGLTLRLYIIYVLY